MMIIVHNVLVDIYYKMEYVLQEIFIVLNIIIYQVNVLDVNKDIKLLIINVNMLILIVLLSPKMDIVQIVLIHIS
jgi:hypothetical protein